MDIDGGMRRDIYDSMAQGVQGAACVVPFMTQAYSDSENCRLELKFAKQSGIPIVPVNLNGGEAKDEWKPSGWLGIIVAGSLWTWLGDDCSESDIDNIVGQIKLAVPEWSEAAEAGGARGGGGGNTAGGGNGVGVDGDFSVQELREELERLKLEIGTGGSKLEPAGIDGLCPLPAGVQPLPPGMRVSTKMQKLVKQLLSPQSRSRVGFHGMGGIGKTTTSCWVCRDEQIRQHFSWIVWCTLGQTPELIKSMGSVYLQLTGHELQDTTVEDAKEKLKNAFRGKDVLLVLDDIWEKDHELFLNFLDEASENKSRCLLSSRVESVLEGCDIVEIGLPSQNEAIQMLLYAAGVDASAKPPREAVEVCRFCKMLPLHIGIAGKIIRSMGVEHDADWSGVVEELQATGSQSVEDAIISSGVRSINAAQREGAAMLFQCFAYVPEDCKVPFEMMQLLLETHMVAAGSSPPTRLTLRRWLKLLIDRSLVLGPIDAPSLHDIVLDYVLSQKSAAELAAGHGRVVEELRAARPERGWVPEECFQNPLARYLLTNIDFHLREAGEAVQLTYVDDFVEGPNVDGRTDAIPVGCARVLGPDVVEALADEAAARGAHWVAAKRYGAAALANIQLCGLAAAFPQWVKCATACETVQPSSSGSGGGCTADMLTQLHFRAVNWIMKTWDPAAQAKYGADMARLGECEIIKAEPETFYITLLFTKMSPNFMTGDVFLLGNANNELLDTAGQNYLSSSCGTFEAAVWLCRKFFFDAFCLDCSIRSRKLSTSDQEGDFNFDWDAHAGHGGKLYLESALAFDWANMHTLFTANVSTNNFIVGGPLFGYVLRWGIAGHAPKLAAKLLQDVSQSRCSHLMYTFTVQNILVVDLLTSSCTKL
eukprot:SAG11_NODE_728_length_7495_cov_3.384397_2_plen_878_part_00